MSSESEDEHDAHVAGLVKRSSSPSTASSRGWEKIESRVFSADFPAEPPADRPPSLASNGGRDADAAADAGEPTPEATPKPTPRPSESGSPRKRGKGGKRPRVQPEDLHHGVNLLLGQRPDGIQGDIVHYHDEATRLVIAVLTICTLVGFAIGTLRLHVGWTFGLLGLVAYVQRAKLERMRDSYMRDAQAKPVQAPQGEFVGESVSWLNDIVNVAWPMTNPDLFVSLLDLCVRARLHSD